MDVGEINGRRLHIGRRLDYRLRLWLWAPTSASRAVSAVAELVVFICRVTAVMKFVWADMYISWSMGARLFTIYIVVKDNI